MAALAAAAALSLAIAIGITTFVFPHRQQPATGNDFAWLTKAMDDCDAEATKQQSTLYFLIVPLASRTEDEPQWRSQSLNEIGNATLLSADVALEGLRSQALRISVEDYSFNVRDQANTLYNWRASAGAARLAIPNAESIEGFNVQFQTRRRTADTAWGNAFVRRRGNCYWVNAIIGN
jgi:hypothetical protein